MVGSPCKHEDASASINHPITRMNVLRILAQREAIAAKVVSLLGGRDAMRLPRILLAAGVVIGCAWNSALAQQKSAVELGALACSFSQSGPVETGRAGVEVCATCYASSN